MPRVRKILGRDERVCPACGSLSWFVRYESWMKSSRFTRIRTDVRQAAECENCGYRVTASSISPEGRP